MRACKIRKSEQLPQHFREWISKRFVVSYFSTASSSTFPFSIIDGWMVDGLFHWLLFCTDSGTIINERFTVQYSVLGEFRRIHTSDVPHPEQLLMFWLFVRSTTTIFVKFLDIAHWGLAAIHLSTRSMIRKCWLRLRF